MQDSQGGGKHEKQETVTQQCKTLCSCKVQRARNNKKRAGTGNRGFSKRELWTPCCTLNGLSWEKKPMELVQPTPKHSTEKQKKHEMHFTRFVGPRIR